MTRDVPGTLNIAALAKLTADTESADRMRHFHLLTCDQQAEAIRRLAQDGHTEHTIARATGLAVEFIRRVLANPTSQAPRT